MITNNKPNRLIKEKSPYLLQHAFNPIDWFPWSEEAFEIAKRENKPIFLSIGYSTCHWWQICIITKLLFLFGFPRRFHYTEAFFFVHFYDRSPHIWYKDHTIVQRLSLWPRYKPVLETSNLKIYLGNT